MPLYEYACEACGQRFEIIQKFSDPAPAACRKCGSGPVHRLQSSPAFQFKGSGWYVTDYAGKGKGGDGGNHAGPTTAKDDKAADNKTETKSSDSSAVSSQPASASTPATPTKD